MCSCSFIQCLNKMWHRMWFCVAVYLIEAISFHSCAFVTLFSNKIPKISHPIKHWHSIRYSVFTIPINIRRFSISNKKIIIKNQLFVCLFFLSIYSIQNVENIISNFWFQNCPSEVIKKKSRIFTQITDIHESRA